MYFTYIWRELRRRSRQALVISIGLAVGIGLVVTVSATAAGVKNAEAQVLHSLYGVGTDMTVTKTPARSSGGSLRFGGIGIRHQNGRARRPAPGTHISRDVVRPTLGQPVFAESYVAKVALLKDVSAATAGLTMTDTNFSGTIPSFGAGPPTGRAAFAVKSFSVDGVQISSSGVGPIDSSEITQGSYFSAAQKTALDAIVSSSYATSNDLKVGSSVTVAGKKTSVIGIADLPSGAADVYLPLGTAQALSGEKGEVNIVYVGAKSASQVSSLASAVKNAVPGSTVTTSADLAKQVTGSLSSASSLATNLGKWLSIAALAVAFAVAALLMVAAVSRRVREFGTLKAIGWRTRRIVGEVTGEGVSLGVVGAVLGLLFGIAGAAIVSAVAPALTATTSSPLPNNGFPGSASSTSAAGGGGLSPFADRLGTAAHSVLVHLTAPLQGGTVLLAIGLALAGGLITGMLGAWRAARLRPATALQRVA